MGIKKKFRRIKNSIIKAITAVMSLILLLSMCAMDSETIPVVAFTVSVSWLMAVYEGTELLKQEKQKARKAVTGHAIHK